MLDRIRRGCTDSHHGFHMRPHPHIPVLHGVAAIGPEGARVAALEAIGGRTHKPVRLPLLAIPSFIPIFYTITQCLYYVCYILASFVPSFVL